MRLVVPVFIAAVVRMLRDGLSHGAPHGARSVQSTYAVPASPDVEQVACMETHGIAV